MRNLSLQNYPCTCGRSLNKQKSIQNKWFYQKLWFQIEMPIPTKPLNQFKKKKIVCVCVRALIFKRRAIQFQGVPQQLQPWLQAV